MVSLGGLSSGRWPNDMQPTNAALTRRSTSTRGGRRGEILVRIDISIAAVVSGVGNSRR